MTETANPDETKNDTDAPDEELEIVLDLDKLTVGEVEDVEELAGLSFSAALQRLSDPERPRTKILRAFIEVLKRRDNPSFTSEDARDVRFSSLRIKLGGDAEPDPPTSPSSTGVQ